jgi:orotate phosphoribosyltransferase
MMHGGEMLTTDEFINFLVQAGALRFGDFTTKSGRKTPYFINTGEFHTGASLSRLAHFYAQAFQQNYSSGVDNLFGPAYKGIPLCAATSIALAGEFGINLSFTFNRKEPKNHGEGGLLIGDNYKERRKIVIIEDVITAGTSIRETFELLRAYPNAEVVGCLISVDRREKLDSGISAVAEVRHEFGIEVSAIATIDDVIAYVKKPGNLKTLGQDVSLIARIEDYRARYGV